MSQFLSKEKRLLLAQALQSKDKRQLLKQTFTQARPAREPIRRRPDPFSPTPLSSAQQRFWFLHQLDPTKGHCNIVVAFSLTGELDVAAFSETLREIVRRHEILRTVFPLQDGEPAQVLCENAGVDLSVQDLSGFPPSAREEAARAIFHEQSVKPFNIAAEPGVRFRILRLSEKLHWWLLVAHHMVFDTWSMGVFGREMSSIYDALRAGKPPSLEEPEIQYADFTRWERSAQEEDGFVEQLSYWKKRLQGAPELLRLPVDRLRSPFNGHRGKSIPFAFGESLADAMSAISHKERASTFIILLTSLTVLIHRYGGGRDIVIGSAVATRKPAETEALIGCFMNTMVFRTRLTGDPSFRDLLRQVRDEALEAYEHGDVPFERVIAALNPKRSPSYSPYSQVMVIVQNAELPRLAGPSTAISRLPISERFVSQQDLTIHVRSLEGGLRGLIDYNSDLFDEATVERLLKHFEQLISTATSNPDLPISQLDVLTPVEINQLAHDMGGMAATELETDLVHRRIERQVEAAPDRVAIICAGEHLTYGELNRRANNFAYQLIRLGAKPEQRVAVCLKPSVAKAIALLAVLKSGAACIPLDHSMPRARLRAILKKTGPIVLVTERNVAETLDPPSHLPILFISRSQQVPASQMSNPVVPLLADNLAYVLYSSGATGSPKPVMITQGGIENALRRLASRIEFQQDDVLAVFSSGLLHGAMPELFMPLMRGASAEILSIEEVSDSVLLRSGNWPSAATAMQATPLIWRNLLDSGWVNSPGFKALSWGETLPDDLAGCFAARGARVWSLYGSAETTFWSVSKNQFGPDQPISPGIPVSSPAAYVLDEYLKPTPIGVAGELYLGGMNLARGYLGRPDLTAERFLPDPMAVEPGARVYKTGDIFRYSTERKLCFVSRSEHQATINGVRVNLGEIEAELCNHPAISQAVVISNGAMAGQKKLVAYVVPSMNGSDDGAAVQLSLQDLCEFLKMQLPERMMPTDMIVLEAMPQAASAKINRKALPPFEWTGAGAGRQEPSTETERLISRLWSRVLQVERVGVNDDFFDLGGDSLKAQRVLAQVEREIGIRIPVLTAFSNPTVAQLSLHIDRVRRIV